MYNFNFDIGKTPFKFLQTIEFWIIILFVSRLENIMIPAIDTEGWRQTLTLSFTRNMWEVDSNILYPRMDIGGETEGIMAAEFPIFNYITFLFYKIFGAHDWIGRVINLTISSAGLWFFHNIIKRLSTEKIAFYSTLFYAVSITFRYARKTMPDTFALSLVFIGVYFAFLYLEKYRYRDLILCFILTTLGLLSKMPSACGLMFLTVPMFNSVIELKYRLRLALTLGIGAAIMSLWYFAWVPYLLETYHNQLFWPVSISEGWATMVRLADEAWSRFTDIAFGSRIAFMASVMGLGAMIVQKQRILLTTIILYSIIFFIFIIKTDHVFATHKYYIIPFTPIMGITAGYFFAEWQVSKWLKLPIAFLILNICNNVQRLDMFPDDSVKYLLKLEHIMDNYVGKNEKIMINEGIFNPMGHYFAHRKGWGVNDDVVSKADWMPDFKKQGLKYIVVDRHRVNDSLPYQLIYEDADFRLYKP